MATGATTHLAAVSIQRIEAFELEMRAIVISAKPELVSVPPLQRLAQCRTIWIDIYRDMHKLFLFILACFIIDDVYKQVRM